MRVLGMEWCILQRLQFSGHCLPLQRGVQIAEGNSRRFQDTDFLVKESVVLHGMEWQGEPMRMKSVASADNLHTTLRIWRSLCWFLLPHKGTRAWQEIKLSPASQRSWWWRGWTARSGGRRERERRREKAQQKCNGRCCDNPSSWTQAFEHYRAAQHAIMCSGTMELACRKR